MAARYVEQFTVRTAEELAELEAAIGEGQLEAIVVDVPDGASAFQTARDFRHLLTIARSADVDVEFSSDDPLRRELAKILGLRLASDTVLDTPVVEPPAPVDPSVSKTYRIVRSTAVETIDVTADQPNWNDADTRPAFRPWQRPVVDQSDDADDDEQDDSDVDDDGSYSFVIHPPTARRSATGPDERKARPADTISTFDLWGTTTYHDPFTPPVTRRGRQFRPLLFVSLLVTIAIVGSMLMLFLLPAATIAVTPVESSVNASLTYGVALPGTAWDIAIAPENVSTTLRFTANVPTTGERFVPDQPARGSVLLTNASTQEVFVPVGTVLIAVTGLEFVTTGDITVPAADPYGSLTIGSATAEVAAVNPGPDSNVEAEVLYGQLDSGIYFLNREPIGGGSMRRIATVSQVDIDGLRDQAKQGLDEKAVGAIESRLVDGQQLLANSETRSQIQYMFNHEAGADAESVSVDASLAISAQAYSFDNIHDQARVAVVDRLQVKAGEAATVLPDSLETTAPQPIDGSGETAFAVFASATVRSIVDETVLESVRTELAGTDLESAVARIEQVAGVGSVTIDNSPDWLGGRMPRLESRIQIEVVHAAGVQAETTSSGP